MDCNSYTNVFLRCGGGSLALHQRRWGRLHMHTLAIDIVVVMNASHYTFTTKSFAPSDWRSNCQWIGLRHNDTAWYWQGLNSDILSNTSPLWDSGEPDTHASTSCGCLCMNYNSYERLHDCDCYQTQLKSLCEKPAE